MGYPVGVNFMRVEQFFHGTGKEWSTIYWYTTLSAFPGSFDISSLAANLEATLASDLVNCLEAAIQIDGINVQVHNGGLVRSIDNYSVHLGNISGTATPLPDDVCVVVSRLTTTSGKSGRGRMYFSGLPSTHVNENKLNGSGQSNWAAAATTMKAAFVNQTMTWSPANYSRLTTAFHAAVDFIPELILGTQRRRRPRR